MQPRQRVDVLRAQGPAVQWNPVLTDPAVIIKGALSASIALLVVALGMRASFADATSLFRTAWQPPHRLVRALVAIHLLVPALAIGVALLLDLSPSIRLALLAMAVSPIPPILPGKQLKAGGDQRYIFGLLVAVSLVSCLTIPAAVALLGQIFGKEAHVGLFAVARLIATSVLLPLLVGLLFRHLAPGLADRLGPWCSRLGTALLMLGVIPVLMKVWPSMVALAYNGAAWVIAAVVVAAMAVGHLLGGPHADERSALAMASAMRHPGVALAIIGLNAPDEPGAAAGVLFYLLIATLLTTLYGLWVRRMFAPNPP